MIALDTNILIYSRRAESPHHEAARRIVVSLAEGEEPWALPWPCVYEYVRVVTHPYVFELPSPMSEVLEDLEELFTSASLSLLGDGPSHARHSFAMIEAAHAVGNLAHDAHIAALCREHGVRELWTLDRDFSRFPGLVARNPFSGPEVHEPRRRYRVPPVLHDLP